MIKVVAAAFSIFIIIMSIMIVAYQHNNINQEYMIKNFDEHGKVFECELNEHSNVTVCYYESGEKVDWLPQKDL